MSKPAAADPAQSLLELPLKYGKTAPPLQRQLHQRLRQAILDGWLVAGGRLPGSRSLAERLSISRNTVTIAYEQLAAEGYVRADRQGTTVIALRRPVGGAQPQVHPLLAERLRNLSSASRCDEPPLSLRPGIPDLSHFPMTSWRNAVERVLRNAGAAVLNYGHPLGEPKLRTSIARHVAMTRGVRCSPEQIVITEGAREAISLCVRLLTQPGDTAWVEDPGYQGAKVAMFAGDLRIVPKRVDADGLVSRPGDWRTRPPRLIYTTPSHQYPTGAVLAVARRLALLEAAQRHAAWIIEDDYDSEFRHAGQPIGAMQGLLDHAPVLYVGTFSKTMFPALRIGFLVLPRNVLAAARQPLAELLRGGQRHMQLALADFMESGQFGRHLGRMRRLYRDRQHALREAINRHLKIPHSIEGGHCGLHLTVRLPRQYCDRRISAAARAHGLAPAPLSDFLLKPLPEDNGLVLGYGNTSAEAMDSRIRLLAKLAVAAGDKNPLRDTQ